MKSEYTAKQIDNMEVEEIEALAYNLNQNELQEWADWGYSGERYVEIMERRKPLK